MDKYKSIIQYFDYLESTYHAHICIKDFYGFFPISGKVNAQLGHYLVHNSGFCLYMKSDRNTYHKCVSMSKKMHDKLMNSPHTFCGACHMGLKEYVIPIIRNNLVLGSINLGFFPSDEAYIKERLQTVCSEVPSFDFDTAFQLYRNTIHPLECPLDIVLVGLELSAGYLALLYPDVDSLAVDGEKIKSQSDVSNEDSIVSRSLVYIADHINSPISIEELAAHAFCSSSYLSHVFKKRTNMSVNNYITQERIRIAKNYLIHTDMPIHTISSSVGFDDPNYFSRIFSKYVEASPTHFRIQFGTASNVADITEN